MKNRVSESCGTLVEAYPAALVNRDKMRGFKRALTLYCRRRSQQTGSTVKRCRAVVKSALTRAGYDTSSLI